MAGDHSAATSPAAAPHTGQSRGDFASCGGRPPRGPCG
ncbi:hypothetical protein ATSB10_21220 [Dyella thiooxydans]|uniref:Uncharacterized protein n=1 Tax=Dyella thiooxydans TaxID=445710 RepID=A0A160N192_9GAMM|nr:hypothetical protein ATSB10_21220 [Dyella thiooxydans]